MNQAGSPQTPIGKPPAPAPGAPEQGLGALIKEQILDQAWRRDKGRDLAPLLRLGPLVRAHPMDAILGMVFMLVSSGAILALTAGARWVIDRGFAVHDKTHLMRVFLLAGAVAGVLAAATGL